MLIFLCAGLLACAGNVPDATESDFYDVTPSSGTTLAPASLTLDNRDGCTACGDAFTVAVTVSGDVLFTGNCAPVFRDRNELTDCVYVDAKEKTAAGITKIGTVKVAGEWKALFAGSAEWRDIVSLSIGHEFMVGLNERGEILACGHNAYGKCDTETVGYALAVSAGRNHFAALLTDGSIVIRGAYADVDTFTGRKDFTEVVCGDFSIVALTESGEIISFNADSVSSWKNVHDLRAYGSAFAAVSDDRIVSTDKDLNGISAEGMTGYSLGGAHVALTMRDGSVECAGETENMQCKTEHWKLGVTIESGFITGIPDKTSFAEAERLISAAAGKDAVIAGEGEYAGTGMTASADGEVLGTILIYGDCSGDGLINTLDSSLMKEYVQDEKKLEGVYAKAAHVLHYLSDVKSIGNDEIITVTRYEAGYAHIDQHVYDPYAESMAKYNKTNSDTVGYIRVDGTRIDYPIMYGANYYYHYRDIYKHHSGVGSIYSAHDGYKRNNVVIGHNARRSGKMFHGLHNIEDRGDALLTFENRIINVTVYQTYSTWELYAVYETGPREPLSTQINNLNSMDDFTNEQIQEWIDGQIARSTTKLGVYDVTYEDELLTMYTCGDEYYSDPDSQSRLYLFFRRVG